jgi:hypothetical protein
MPGCAAVGTPTGAVVRDAGGAQNFSGTLMNWDITYWAQRQQEALFNLTDEAVRPYFALPNVLEGLFGVSFILRPHSDRASCRRQMYWVTCYRRLFLSLS